MSRFVKMWQQVTYFIVVVCNVAAETICRDQRWYNESQYCLIDEQMQWQNAFTSCFNMGGGLAIPDSQEEQEFIWEMFTDTISTGDMWSGCRLRNGRGVYPGQGDRGCPYITWAPSEPRDALECARMWRMYAGMLDDIYCNSSMIATCEIPSQPLVTPGMSCLQRYTDTRSSSHCLTGHAVKEFAVKEFTVKGVISCGSACRGEPACRSFQLQRYSPGEKICQLNNITRNQAQETDIKLDNSCNYFNF